MLNRMVKCVFAATIAASAVPLSTPSFAAKKAAAPPPACTIHTTQKTCANGVCAISWCGHDGKWYPTPFVCWEPFCWPK